MTAEKNADQERVDSVNAKSAEVLQDWLKRFDTGEIASDDLLSYTYAGLIAAILMGYRPEALVEDAKAAAGKIMGLAEEE